jgi:hypothetical protein
VDIAEEAALLLLITIENYWLSEAKRHCGFRILPIAVSFSCAIHENFCTFHHQAFYEALKRAEGFKKRLDDDLVELGTPHLFTQQPERAPRVVSADIVDGASLKEGQALVIQKIGNRLAVICGIQEIGQLLNPHSEIVSAVEKSFGYAKGIIQTFHAEALVAEISIC